MSKISRRNFLITAGATTAATLIVNGCSSSSTKSDESAGDSSPAPSPVAAADTPEVTTAKLGFIALTDSAPLIIAKEKGLFAKYGMPDVEVVKQASWAVTRDNLELGSGGGGIDGAHILTPMSYLMAAGKITKGGAKVPMNILARLNVNGQGISLSNAYTDLKVSTDSSSLKEAFAKGKSSGKEMKCAVTFPGGTHDLWMRYWLAAGGIDPDKDVSTIVVPTPPNGGQHQGQQHGSFLCGRTVECSNREPKNWLHGHYYRRALERPSGKGASHASRLGRAKP